MNTLFKALLAVAAAAVTASVTYWVAHDRTHGNEKGAVRIVLAEMQNNGGLMRIYGRHSQSRVSDAAWRTERQELAGALSDSEWAWVSRYYRDLDAFRAGRKTAVPRLRRDEGCTLVALRVRQSASHHPKCAKLPAGSWTLSW